MTCLAITSWSEVVIRMPAGVGCIRAAALTIRSSAPSRKASIAASAIRIPPLCWTTTSQSSGRRKAGKAELASAPEVGPVIGPFRAAPAPVIAGRSQSSFLALRVDRLAALEHRDESLDLLLPTGFGFHVVSAKGQREPVLRTEFRQHCLCFGLCIDRRLQIAGDLHILAALIGAHPAPVGLGRIDLF